MMLKKQQYKNVKLDNNLYQKKAKETVRTFNIETV